MVSQESCAFFTVPALVVASILRVDAHQSSLEYRLVLHSLTQLPAAGIFPSNKHVGFLRRNADFSLNKWILCGGRGFWGGGGVHQRQCRQSVWKQCTLHYESHNCWIRCFPLTSSFGWVSWGLEWDGSTSHPLRTVNSRPAVVSCNSYVKRMNPVHEMELMNGARSSVSVRKNKSFQTSSAFELGKQFTINTWKSQKHTEISSGLIAENRQIVGTGRVAANEKHTFVLATRVFIKTN